MLVSQLIGIFMSSIAVRLKFSPENVCQVCEGALNESNGMEEDADDIIESISQPYLAWSRMD